MVWPPDPGAIGLPVQALDTPALILDLDAVERNLDRMDAALAGTSVRARPHTKTHKVPVLALEQLRRGAIGICCAKLGVVPDLLTTLADDWLGRMFLDMAARYKISVHGRKVRESSLAERIELYRTARIEDQHAWYISKARRNTDTARLWFVLLVLFNVLAIGLCVVRLSPEGREMWEHTVGRWPIDFFTIAAGSVLAWMQTKRFQELAASYTLTAYEIGILRADLPAKDSTESRFAHFVADSENAFSREHTQWRARRDTE